MINNQWVNINSFFLHVKNFQKYRFLGSLSFHQLKHHIPNLLVLEHYFTMLCCILKIQTKHVHHFQNINMSTNASMLKSPLEEMHYLFQLNFNHSLFIVPTIIQIYFILFQGVEYFQIHCTVPIFPPKHSFHHTHALPPCKYHRTTYWIIKSLYKNLGSVSLNPMFKIKSFIKNPSYTMHCVGN